MRTLTEISQQLPTSPETGLAPEAAVAQSRARFGVNKLTPLPREPIWRKFLEKFDEPIIKVLLGAALLSMFVGMFHANVPILAGSCLGAIVLAFVALFVLGQQQWVPTLLFVSAVLLLIVGIAAAPARAGEMVEGVAVMV